MPCILHIVHAGPVVCMVWEGKDAVRTGRKMLGATNPLASEPGTIRGDNCLEVGRNICHGSDSVEAAEREVCVESSGEQVDVWMSQVDPRLAVGWIE